MTNNSNLNRTRRTPNDELYTRERDIVAEISTYPISCFKGKVIYCNCDGPKSNFYKFFKNNFNSLGLKKLICTSYSKWGCIIDRNGEKILHLENGDFRSPECRRYMAMADLVVSNPPFSLATSYIQQLMEFKVKFLFIAPQSVIHYAPIYPYFAKGQIKVGNRTVSEYIDTHGNQFHVGTTMWFTNLPILPKKPFKIVHEYNPIDYPKYDDYDAIHIKSIRHIPYGYHGYVGITEGLFTKDWQNIFKLVKVINPTLNGKKQYSRILAYMK